jgi:ribosomal protein L15
VVLLVVDTTIGMFQSVFILHEKPTISCLFRTNFDKYHPGYFGKVGMRRFHLTRNAQWNPTINVDKLWTLVPEEHKKDLTEDSQVVPVVNVLDHGYSKVLGNGRFVPTAGNLRFAWD